MYVYVLYIIFWCKFRYDGDCIIWRLYFENVSYGHHQTSFFNVNSIMTVITSSWNYILKIYDMISTLHSPTGPCALRADCAESDGVRASLTESELVRADITESARTTSQSAQT